MTVFFIEDPQLVVHPHPESDIQPFVPPMPMPPMVGSGHHFFLFEVEVEVRWRRGCLCGFVSGISRLGRRGRSGRGR
jgi:hypothetical protein